MMTMDIDKQDNARDSQRPCDTSARESPGQGNCCVGVRGRTVSSSSGDCGAHYFSSARLTDRGMEALTRPFLRQTTPNRLEDFSVAGCSLLTNEVCLVLLHGATLTVVPLQKQIAILCRGVGVRVAVSPRSAYCYRGLIKLYPEGIVSALTRG